MTNYINVFGGATIYPSEVSYSSLTLTADVTLVWPEETSTGQDLATKIIDVSANAGTYSIILPSAEKAATGETILFNNIGGSNVTVRDADLNQVVVLTPGTLWQIYLTDNTSAAGFWQTLQYGSTTSSANASALAGTGIVAVGTLLSQSVPITTFNSNYLAGVPDRAKMFNWTGAGGTFTLPSAQLVGANWFCYLRNSGSGNVTATPTGLNTINDGASLSFQPSDSAIIASDGTNFYTIGFGQQAIFAFDYTVIDVSGAGDYTLAGSELNRIAYDFIGVLTNNRNIIVPATVQQYWVTNDTAGAFDLKVKTAAGTGIIVAAGLSAILYCDGTNVVSAVSGTGLSNPVSITQGGTGAMSASNARINLGGTSVGIAVFTSASQSAGIAALGGTATGEAVFTAASQSAGRTALGAGTTGSTLFTSATAASARGTLGSTVVGDALFTAASASAARTTLGATVTGDSLFTAANAGAGRTTLGATTVGSAIFTAANTGAVWSTLGPAQAGNVDGGTF